MYNCPNRRPLTQSGVARPNLFAEACTGVPWNLESDNFVRKGKLQDKLVQVLVDTACTLIMVRADFLEVMKNKCPRESLCWMCAW